MLFSLSAVEMLVTGFVAKIAPREKSVFGTWYFVFDQRKRVEQVFGPAVKNLKFPAL
jgi:hypothetical protein